MTLVDQVVAPRAGARGGRVQQNLASEVKLQDSGVAAPTSTTKSHGGAAETVGGSAHGMVHMDRHAGCGRGGFVARQDVRVGGGRHDDRHARPPITDHDRGRRQRESGGPITPLRDDNARAASTRRGTAQCGWVGAWAWAWARARARRP